MFNPLTELEKANITLNGMYRGVVVDNLPPKNDGRIRVKIFGVYDDLADEEIPWCEPALPINTGGKLDQGSCYIPEVDSFVFCFFDGLDVNHPIYFATCPSIPNNDEPDIPRESRVEKLNETHIQTKLDERTTDIMSSDETEWSEPEPWYDAVYPWNHVVKLSNGIVFELDNTESRERVHIYHPSNTFIEINSSGDMIIKNSGNKFVLTLGEKKEYIAKDSTLDIDKSRYKRVSGDERDLVEQENIKWIQDRTHLTVESDRRELCNANRDLQVIDDKRESIGVDKHLNVVGNQFEKIGENKDIQVGSNNTEDIGGNKEISIGGNLVISTGGNIEFDVGGNFHVKAGGTIAFDGATIHENDGVASPGSPGSPTEPTAPIIPTLPHEETQD